MPPPSLPTSKEEEEFWIFGYGLIWKPPPHYDLRVPGYIKGYVRRFWQASEDHRGTPSSPGRVVTLIERTHYDTLVEKTSSQPPPPHVYGAAYRIPPAHIETVKTDLDIREINGYTITHTAFYALPSPPSPPSPPSSTQGGSHQDIPGPHPHAQFQPKLPTHSLPSSSQTQPHIIAHCLLYIGLPTNPQFVGPEPVEVTAGVIRGARGPSGGNREYLFGLRGALEGLGGRDGFVEELCGLVGEDGEEVVVKGEEEGVGEEEVEKGGV